MCGWPHLEQLHNVWVLADISLSLYMHHIYRYLAISIAGGGAAPFNGRSDGADGENGGGADIYIYIYIYTYTLT